MPAMWEQAGNIPLETNPLFWDCECKKNYIHLKSCNFCVHCGSRQKDQPDSRANEVRTLMNLGIIQLVRIKE